MNTSATVRRALKTARAASVEGVPRSIREMFPLVTRVVDATEAVQVSVTPRDCGRGARSGDPVDCAMARALQRQHEADGAIIGLTRSYVVMGDTATRFTTPATVAREITSFDRHGGFSPGEYKLSPMSPSQRPGSRSKPEHGHGSHTSHRIVHKATARVRSLR